MAPDELIDVTLPHGISARMTLTQLIKYQRELGEVGINSAQNKRRTKRQKAVLDNNDLSNFSSAPEKFLFLIEVPKNIRQRKVLALIKGRGDTGITIDELSNQLGDKNSNGEYDANITSGTITGIVRNAKKAGLDRDDVLYKPSKTGRVWTAGTWLMENEVPDP